MAKQVRPKREVSSPRSTSSRITMAVEDKANPPPMTMAVNGRTPNSKAMPQIAMPVTRTWAAPRAKVRACMTRMRSNGNSRPMVNSRNTTPSSPKAFMVPRSVTSAKPLGPITAPATR